MRYQVDFHETRAFFIPFGEGANGNQVFEQTARFGGTQAMRRLNTPRTQATVNAGRTDFQKQLFGLLGDRDFLATVQYFHGFGQDRLQALRTNLSVDFPDLLKYLRYLATINGFVGLGFSFKVVLNMLFVFEYSDGILPMVASG